jgi:predicted acetyltransferase
MAIEIRPATPEMALEFAEVMRTSFGWEPADPSRWDFEELWQPERSFCAFDSGRMVATSGALSLELTVPGSTLACGGTTMVSVLPTHRRRGILRRMMEAHLGDVADRGEPLAALWASDSAIYGRFGYGIASQQAELFIDRQHVEPHRLAPAGSTVELVDAAEAGKRIPEIFETVRPGRPGFFRRSELWWQNRRFSDRPDDRSGFTSMRFAIAAGDEGYAIYRRKSRWDDGHGTGEVKVLDLQATTPRAAAGLWRLMLEQDLVARITADLRPPDDPVFDLLAGRRRVKATWSDGIWVRLMNLEAALAGRRYQVEGRLVVETTDPLNGRGEVVELEGGPEGASCRPTDQSPDLTLDREDLGACYLGWARFRDLARAGRVAGEAGALLTADLMFGWSPQPWCPEIF